MPTIHFANRPESLEALLTSALGQDSGSPFNAHEVKPLPPGWPPSRA